MLISGMDLLAACVLRLQSFGLNFGNWDLARTGDVLRFKTKQFDQKLMRLSRRVSVLAVWKSHLLCDFSAWECHRFKQVHLPTPIARFSKSLANVIVFNTQQIQAAFHNLGNESNGIENKPRLQGGRADPGDRVTSAFGHSWILDRYLN